MRCNSRSGGASWDSNLGLAGWYAYRRGPVPDGDDVHLAARGRASTRMTLRNRGEPAGFAKVAGPMMATAMRRANDKDLARLKHILES